MKYGKEYLIYKQLMGFYHSTSVILSPQEKKSTWSIYQQLLSMFHGRRLTRKSTDQERRHRVRGYKYKYTYGNFSNIAKEVTKLQKGILCQEKLGQEKQ